MIKTLVVIGVIVAVLLVALLIYAAMQPDTFRVQRATSIKAPPEKIFPLINNLHQFNIWNPYERKDPNIKGAYIGPASGKGAAYAWESKQVGTGSMEITETAAPSRVAMKLDFVKPLAAHNFVEFTLAPKGDTTEVIWAMNGSVPFMAKVMHIIFNMDKMVGGDFEAGLANLKSLAEK